MLFNSYLFIFCFLPIAVVGFYSLRRCNSQLSIYWLALASLVFYAYWNPPSLALLLLSVTFNFGFSTLIANTRPDAPNKKKALLTFAAAMNLLSIAYFKYAYFIVSNIVGPNNVPEFFTHIALPLAMSFFTFHQIAYLVDVHAGKVTPGTFSRYLLYVSVYPHLIAGPIVRYQEIVPQFSFPVRRGSFLPRILWVGLILFGVGLFKKVVCADTFSVYANDVFAYANTKSRIGLADAWIGAYAYTFQLYFDFSGYSDMAIGLALMLGLKLPVNFYSPYKARNIIEFWQRWHMTLSRFFRDYLYIPLGGNRRGRSRQMANLLFVMLMTGLWHGAGWTFVLWGGFHGVIAVTTHLLKKPFALIEDSILQRVSNGHKKALGQLIDVLCWAVTFHLVLLGWVLFRAKTFHHATTMYKGMFLQSGNPLNALVDYRLYFVIFTLIAAGLFVVSVLPNSVQMMERFVHWEQYPKQGAGGLSWTWRFSAGHAVLIGVIFYLSITTLSQVQSDFLYFNF